MDNHDLAVAQSLGRLESGVTGINERLDKLNGSVARHEKRIGDLETRDAVQDATQKSERETNKTWRNALIPLVKILLALLLGAVLGSKGPDVLKALL